VSDTNVIARIDLLRARADAGECDLVVKANVAGEARGFLYVGGNQFQGDRHSDPLLTSAVLRALAGTAGQEQTYTCVPPTTGNRIGLDRDQDGTWDRRELDCGTDPADPLSEPATPTGACGGATTTSTTSSTSSTSTSSSTPSTSTSTSTSTTFTTSTTAPAGTVTVQATSLKLSDRTGPPAIPEARRLTFKSSTRKDPPANRIVVPARGTASDPTPGGGSGGGGRLFVYNSAGAGEGVEIPLPASGWTALGTAVVPNGYQWKTTSETLGVKSVKVKDDLIAVKGGGVGFAYTLNEPSQGRMAVRLQLGTGTPWCADAPAKATGTPPSTEKTDTVDRFRGAPRTPAPAVCPPLP
jgi:hypothetical protein